MFFKEVFYELFLPTQKYKLGPKEQPKEETMSLSTQKQSSKYNFRQNKKKKREESDSVKEAKDSYLGKKYGFASLIIDVAESY